MKVRILAAAAALAACGCLDSDLALFIPVGTDAYDLPHNRIPEERLEEVAITTADGVRLAAMLATQPDPAAAPSVLFLHGQGGNLDYFWDWVMRLWSLGYNVLAPDYRGFGKSEGSPTEAGVYEDARAALAHLLSRDELDTSRVVIWGFSLGTAVATELATHDATEALVLEAPFTSMTDMVEGSSPYVLPAPWMTDIEMDTLGRIRGIGSPLVVAHGTADDRVPFWMGRAVYERATVAKRFVEVQGAGHDEVLARAGSRIIGALAEVAPVAAP